jgi:hypothetical protein
MCSIPNYSQKFLQEKFLIAVTGCGGEFLVHATFVQALCVIGSVLLLLEGNDEDSEWI